MVSPPYPGLRPFRPRSESERGEEHLFFGREQHIDAQIQKLEEMRFLAVVGVSGSGKSSLVTCGLIPALHGGYMGSAGTFWRVAIIRPGGNPLEMLSNGFNAEFGLEASQKVDFSSTSTNSHSPSESSFTSLGPTDVDGPLVAATKTHLSKNEDGFTENLLIVVDQFEELFRFNNRKGLTKAEKEIYNDKANTFIQLLLESTRQWTCPLYVVLTVRSDFLGQCSQFEDLPEAINKSIFLVPRLYNERDRHHGSNGKHTNGLSRTGSELEDAIEGPIAVANTKLLLEQQMGGAQVRMEPALLDEILTDIGDEPANLPVLQHALNRTWIYWHDRVSQQPNGQDVLYIEYEDYKAAGKIEGAIDQHAEAIYRRLTKENPANEEYCKRMFQALTDITPDGNGIRRPTTIGELVELSGAPTEKEILDIVKAFRDDGSFLYFRESDEEIMQDEFVDISHESLMRHWKTLSGWIEEQAEAVKQFRSWYPKALVYEKYIKAKADGTADKKMKRAARSALLDAFELQMYQQWRNKHPESDTWYRRYPLETKEPTTPPSSDTKAQKTIKTLMEQLVNKSEAEKKLQTQVKVLGWSVLALALIISALFLVQRNEVVKARKRAAALVVTNYAQREFELAEDQYDLFYLLSRHAMLFNKESGGAIQDNVHQVLRTAYNHAANSQNDETAYDPLILTDHRSTTYQSITFHPSGDSVVAIAKNRTNTDASAIELGRYPFENASLGDALVHEEGSVNTIAFHPTKKYMLAAGDSRGRIVLWTLSDALEAEDKTVSMEDSAAVTLLAFGLENQEDRLVSINALGLVRTWNTSNGNLDPIVPAFALPSNTPVRATAMVVSPSDTQPLILGDQAGGIWHCTDWDVPNPICVAFEFKEERTMHEGRIDAMAIHGDMLVTGSSDLTVRVWRIVENRLLELMSVLPGSENAVSSVAISNNGQHIVAGYKKSEILMWHSDKLNSRPIIFSNFEGITPRSESNVFFDFEVSGLAFEPTDEHFISINDWGVARKWRTNPRIMADSICKFIEPRMVLNEAGNRVSNLALTREQWNEFTGGKFWKRTIFFQERYGCP